MLRTLTVLLIASALLTTARGATPFQAGDAKKPEPSVPAPSKQKIIDDINADCVKVVDQLTKSDPGAATRAGQDRILENIDRLLKQQDPNPPKNSSQSPPSSPPPPKNPSAKPPEANPSAANPMPQPKALPQQAKANADATPKKQPASGEPKSQGPNSLEEMKRETNDKKWPPLPPRMMQDIDAIGPARFIRNHEELLRAYYRRLAESSRKDAD